MPSLVFVLMFLFLCSMAGIASTVYNLFIGAFILQKKEFRKKGNHVLYKDTGKLPRILFNSVGIVGYLAKINF